MLNCVQLYTQYTVYRYKRTIKWYVYPSLLIMEIRWQRIRKNIIYQTIILLKINSLQLRFSKKKKTPCVFIGIQFFIELAAKAGQFIIITIRQLFWTRQEDASWSVLSLANNRISIFQVYTVLKIIALRIIIIEKN